MIRYPQSTSSTPVTQPPSPGLLEPKPNPRTTYSQDWPNYNLAQQNEKDRFLVLLSDLCDNLRNDAKPRGKGRPSAPLAVKVFA